MSAEFSDEVRAFLESMTVPGVLSTLGAKGGPVTSAVWYGFLDGDIIISTPAGRPKARNARADARVSFIVDTKESPYRGVAVEGDAEVIDDPENVHMQNISRRYLSPDLPDWTRQRIAHSDRVVLRIHPRRVRPWNISATP